MDLFPFSPKADDEISVCVPSSKSIMSRALILAALSRSTVRIRCGAYGEDTQAMLRCLEALGIALSVGDGEICVTGCNGDIPKRHAELDVGNSGTAARFLTVALALCGGNYTITASEQMQKRPMDVLACLQNAGVTVEYGANEGGFPFTLVSDGLKADKIAVGTDISTQFASGLLLAAGFHGNPFTVKMTGSRTRGSYISMTLKMLTQFGIRHNETGNEITVFPAGDPPAEYTVEPDVSGACYFYALSLLCGARVRVGGVHANSMQGDLKFLGLLEQKGVRVKDTPEGIVADGRNVPYYNGFDEDLGDFSDQAMTVAVLSAYASMPSILRGLAHIRSQECDRIAAIVENLNALGVHSFTNGEDVFIEPAPVHGGTVKTFGDHRIAMAFALMGLKTKGIAIDDPDCCKKTFPDYFRILEGISKTKFLR